MDKQVIDNTSKIIELLIRDKMDLVKENKRLKKELKETQDKLNKHLVNKLLDAHDTMKRED